MGTITTADGTEIFYKDWGTGQPIVFSHGWPLSVDDWDTQMMFFLLHAGIAVALRAAGGFTPMTSSSSTSTKPRPLPAMAAVTGAP